MSDFAGKGTTIQRYGTVSASSSTWTAFAGVKDFTPPNPTKETYDATDYDSGTHRKFVSGLIDGGEVTFTMNFNYTQYAQVKSDLLEDEVIYYRSILPDTPSTYITFKGFVTNISGTVPVDDLVTADVTIKVTGDHEVATGTPTWTPGDSDDPIA